jgi:predicted AlkP superfamily pyrophosphatase or phosphodiesterase
MTPRAVRLAAVVLLLLLAGCEKRHLDPTVILVSIDGFHPDYQARFDTPVLDRLAREGVQAADGMLPVFPTKTFPNHYSIATGLYPARHGIVGNTMYDPGMDAWFRLSDRDAVEDSRWWLGEPIWVTAEKQDVTAGTFFWPGTEAPVQGVQATYWKRFDNEIPPGDRVGEVLRWLDLPDAERPRLVTLYFSDTDNVGHEHGPSSVEVGEAAGRADGYLGLLVSGLEERGLLDQVNIVVVSDHGMAEVSPDRVIFVDEVADVGESRVVEWSPVLMIEPEPGRRESIEAALDTVRHLVRYDQAALDSLFHFSGSPRIPSIVAVAEAGWSITSSREFLESRRSRFPSGMHGFDPRDPSMAALFVARGPAFRSGYSAAPFENIHVYPLVAHILGLEPADVDGRLDAVRDLLR